MKVRFMKRHRSLGCENFLRQPVTVKDAPF
jgi:hypothetical protein